MKLISHIILHAVNEIMSFMSLSNVRHMILNHNQTINQTAACYNYTDAK